MVARTRAALVVVHDGFLGRDQLRELDPEFMEAYLAFRSVPQRNGPVRR